MSYQNQTTMKTYKLHNGLPAQTKQQWIEYSKGLFSSLLVNKLEGTNNGLMYEESLSFYNLIVKTFKIKTF